MAMSAPLIGGKALAKVCLHRHGGGGVCYACNRPPPKKTLQPPAGAVLVEDPRYTISRHRGCARGPQRGVRRCPRRAIASAALPDTPASRRAPAPAPPRAPPPPSPVRATVRLLAGDAASPAESLARAVMTRGCGCGVASDESTSVTRARPVEDPQLHLAAAA